MSKKVDLRDALKASGWREKDIEALPAWAKAGEVEVEDDDD